MATGEDAVGVERQLRAADRADRPWPAVGNHPPQVLDHLDAGRHAAAGHAEHELHHHRVVEETLVEQLQGQADVAGVEALDLRVHTALAELRGHPPQEREVTLEELLAEVDRPAVQARHLR